MIEKEFSPPAPEFSMTEEFPLMDASLEYYDPSAGGEEAVGEEENESGDAGLQKQAGDRHRYIKKRILAPIAATVATVSLVFSAFDYDPLGSGLPFSNGGYAAGTETADPAFPKLPNLEPNGYVEPFGVLDEEFIFLESEQELSVIAVGSKRGGYLDDNGQFVPYEVSEVPGVSYDPAENVLTLENYSGPTLNVNLMGNGFTVRLIGDNYLEHVKVWGFFYGGSITFTGDGSLTVNRDGAKDEGILLLAEESPSCLMVDRDVTLDVYGKNLAVLVNETTLSKSIYYLDPLRMTGGTRGNFPPEQQEEQRVFFSTVFDGDGNPAVHVTFGK